MYETPADKRTVLGSPTKQLKSSTFDQKLLNKNKIFPVLVDRNYLATKREQNVKTVTPNITSECSLLSFQWILKVECLQDVRRVRLPPFFLTPNRQDANNLNTNSEKDICNGQYLALPLVEYEDIISCSCSLFNLQQSDKHALKYLDDEGEWCTLTVDNMKDALTLSVLRKQFSKRPESCSDVVNNDVTTYKEESISYTNNYNNMKNDNYTSSHIKNFTPTLRMSDGRKNSQNGKMEYKWVVSNNSRNLGVNMAKKPEVEKNLLFSLPAADISAILHLQLCLNDGFLEKLNGRMKEYAKNNDTNNKPFKNSSRRRRKKKKEFKNNNNEANANGKAVCNSCNGKTNITLSTNADNCGTHKASLLLKNQFDKQKKASNENRNMQTKSMHQTKGKNVEPSTAFVPVDTKRHVSNNNVEKKTKRYRNKVARGEIKKTTVEEQKVNEKKDNLNNVACGSINTMKNESENVKRESIDLEKKNSNCIENEKKNGKEITDQKNEMNEVNANNHPFGVNYNWSQQFCEEEDFVMINNY